MGNNGKTGRHRIGTLDWKGWRTISSPSSLLAPESCGVPGYFAVRTELIAATFRQQSVRWKQYGIALTPCGLSGYWDCWNRSVCRRCENIERYIGQRVSPMVFLAQWAAGISDDDNVKIIV
ncbi:hypothetical protein PoB_000228800 [Plakobranchus ocellatus]|uniref:Uncharacterized protein n=1 Tax=Plakobranchus ocellatus TaxID=259542 RepID=A0AAV3XZH9_9GAST|nr:hypothetical protein PoB_000228800 [Plakobranchus ocellatus]